MSDGEYIPRVRTPITKAGFAEAVREAWFEASREAIGTLWAQYALETGRGNACWDNNIGNVKHVSGDGHDYTMLTDVWEIIDGKKVIFQPPHPQTWFRAYRTLGLGMEEHIAFLRKRYAAAWEHVEAGDPDAFARALKAHGYFTGDLGIYARSLVSLLAEWMHDPATRAPSDTLTASPEAPTQPELPAELDGPQGSAEGIADAAVADYQRDRES